MNSLIKKFLEFAIGNGVVMLIGFITSPLVSRLIDTEEYGKAAMFTTTTGLLIVLVMLGMDQAYIRFFNEEHKENRGILLRKSITVPFILNAILSIFLLVFYRKISTFIIGDVSLLVIILIIIENTQNIITNFSLIYVRMQQRAKLYSVLNIINRLAYLLIILTLVNVFKGSYIVIILATVLSNLLRIVVTFNIEKRLVKDILSERRDINTKTDEMIRYGIPFIFSMAITWVFQSIDKVSIKMFLGYDQVGIYAMAMSIIGILNSFQGAFTTFWTPVAYERYKNNKNDTEFFRRINRIVVAGMIFLAINLILFKEIIVLILGERYRMAVYIIPMLSFMPIFYTISETTVLGINFMKKTKYHIVISLISAITNILGNFILVPKIGVVGAALSTAISYLVFFALRTYFSVKLYKVNYDFKLMIMLMIPTMLLAIYSSFNKFDFVIGSLYIIVIIMIGILLRNEIKKSVELVKNKVKKDELN